MTQEADGSRPASSGGTPQHAAGFDPVQDRVAAQPPDRLALLTRDGYLTYGELNARANRLARHLLSLDLDASRPLAIRLERSADFVSAILGALRSGHPYLPFDARQSAHHLAARLREADAAALLTHSALPVELEGLELPVIQVDRERSALARQPGEDPRVPVTPEHLAYCMFTSGSTGRPKCVEVSHGSLAAYPEAFNSRLGIGPGDVYLHSASFAFSASLRQLFVPLTHGAAVALASFEQLRDPLGLLRWMRQEGVTVIDWVPSYLRQVCDELARLAPEPRRGLMDNQVGILIASGEALPWSLVRAWREEAGFTGRIASAYGQTETTGLVAWHELRDEGSSPGDPNVPLGSALPQAELYCLDEAMGNVPAGGTGDLWVAGPCLARGYRGDGPPMRKQPNPFSQWPELLATGDRVRVDPGGGFHFAGRLDDLVKVNGVRVSLGELEAALRNHPGIRDAAVLLVGEGDSSPKLHAFVEPSAGPSRAAVEGDDQALRRFLREHHPDCAVPHAITWQAELPRTTSGKLDRPALRPLAAVEGAPAPVPAPDADTVETVVREAWVRTLGIEQVEGDFFELGGDSLQVIAMLGRITTTLGVDIPLIAAFFGDPTVPGLVRVIRDGMRAAPAPPLVGVPRIPRIS